MTVSQLSQNRGMTEEMWRRWRGHKYIAQSESAVNADFRPVGQVFVTRGHMQRMVSPNDPALDPNGFGAKWDAIWDEKFVWGGLPGQRSKNSPSPAGEVRNIDFREPVELPSVQSISIRNNIDQNGISNCTITIQNIYREEKIGDFVYHVLREGFFSPHFNGDEGFDETDIDIFSGKAPPSSYVRNEDGKVITGLMMPNRKIEVFQGYGDEIQRTFVGLIDHISVDAKSAKMTIECTDFGRVLSETTYNQFSVPPGRYPVDFVDWHLTKGVSRKKWGEKFGYLRTGLQVYDVTHVAARIFGWAGFHHWNRVKAGRIGKINAPRVSVNNTKRHLRAHFTGEHFEKGAYFIDGINQIKTLLGYLFFITPDYHPNVTGAGRFRDPTVYDGDNSKYSIGMPNFVPPNVWNKNPTNGVEQFLESEILLDGGLIYDYQSLRKQMYVVGTGYKTKKGRPRVFGYHAPYGLDCGLLSPIYFNVQEQLGIHLSQLEIQVFIRLVMLQTLIQFNRGQFTVPGWPGATLNKQVDILESSTGTWRRFYVTGFESEMNLGPKSSWKTTVEVVNLDNIYIQRLKRQIKRLMGVNQNTDYDLTMSKSPRCAQTPKWINNPGRGH